MKYALQPLLLFVLLSILSCTKLAQQTSEASLSSLFEDAEANFNREKYAFAKDQFEALIALEPEGEICFASYNYLGYIAEEKGQLQLAKQYYSKSLDCVHSTDPQLTKQYENLGYIHAQLSNFDSAQWFYELALAIDTVQGDSVQIARTLNNLGMVLQLRSEFTKSIELFSSALEFDRRPVYLNNLAISLKKMGNLQEALEIVVPVITILEAHDPYEALPEAYTLVGNIHHRLGLLSVAEQYYKKSLNIRKANNDEQGMASCYNNLGNLFMESTDYHRAVTNILAATKINKHLGNQKELATNLLNLGTVYIQQNLWHQARIELYKTYRIFSNIDDVRGEAHSMNLLAKCYIHDSIPDSAYFALTQAQQLCRSQNLQYLLLENYEQWQEYCQILGDYKSAFSFAKLFQSISDSLTKQNNSKEMLEAQAKYETEQSKRLATELEHNNQQQATQLQLQTMYLWLLGSGAFLVVVVSISIYRNYRLKRSSERYIKHLFRETNHRVSNSLSTLLSILRLQTNELEDDLPKALLQDNQARLEAINLIHNQLTYHEEVTDLNLQEYFDLLLRNLLLSRGISSQEVVLQQDVAHITLAVDKAIPVGLIVNELVVNALKHAFEDQQHKELRVAAMVENEQQLVLEVSDNGRGIVSLEKPGETPGGAYGTRLVNVLVRQLKGSLEVLEKPGTHWRISVPIRA